MQKKIDEAPDSGCTAYDKSRRENEYSYAKSGNAVAKDEQKKSFYSTSVHDACQKWFHSFNSSFRLSGNLCFSRIARHRKESVPVLGHNLLSV